MSCSEARHGLPSLAASYLIIIMRKRVIVRVIGHDTISWGGNFSLSVLSRRSRVVLLGNYLKICQECQIDLLLPPYTPLHQVLVSSGQACVLISSRHRVQSGGVVIIC